MPAAPIPPPFEYLGGRRFAFYPPILQVEANEWTFRQATWSEVLVRNSITGGDLWVPRRFLGEASGFEYPVAVIRLFEQLEYREGSVWPYRRRVIEMPRSVLDVSRQAGPPREHPAPVVGIRLETRGETRASRLVGGAVALGVMGCLAVVGYSWQGESQRRAVFRSLDQTYLTLTGTDQYRTVVQTLGLPDSDRWVTTPYGVRLHLLSYADRGFQAVLTPDGKMERYLGAVDEEGRTLQAVLLPEGSTSGHLLRGLDPTRLGNF